MTDTTLSAEAATLKFDAVYATSVPGLVLWRWPRRVLRRVTGEKVRSASYSLTHEPSGYALLAGVNGAKHTLRLAEGLDLATKLGDLRYKNRPIDWTQEIDTLQDNRNVRVALLVLAEFRLIAEDYPPAVCSWADRNGIDLTIKLPNVNGGLMAQAETDLSAAESAGLKEWSGWLAVPGPVRRKKRVSKTIYWDECPACGERVTGWSTDTRIVPAYRLYKPCGCTVWEPGAAETRSTLNGGVSSSRAGEGGS